MNIAVFASHGGSDLQAIMDGCKNNQINANPSDKLMQVLEENTDALYMYLNCLPDSMFEYKKVTIEDIDELVRTRMIVLRAANKLSDDVDMSTVEKESYAYYKPTIV